MGEQIARGPAEGSAIVEYRLAEVLARQLGYDSLEDLHKRGYSP